MTSYNKPTMGAAALAMLMAFPGAAFSAVDHAPAIGGRVDDRATGGVEIAHMSGTGTGTGMMRPDYGTYGYPCHGYEPRMGRDTPGEMMGRGMMGPDAPSRGMMGQGMMGRGMMDRGMMGGDMMGGDMMGRGMMDPDGGGTWKYSDRVVPSRDLTIDDVRHFFEHRLEMRDNKRLKVGAVTAQDDDRIIAEIMTVDDSLVERLEVDRHTGEMRHVE